MSATSTTSTTTTTTTTSTSSLHIYTNIKYVSASDSTPSQELDLYIPSSNIIHSCNQLCTNMMDHALPSSLLAYSSNLPPLLVYIHGGLWMSRDKQEYRHIGETYTKQLGMAVAIINYRLSREREQEQEVDVYHPAHTEDVAAALSFLCSPSSSAAYHYDCTCVLLMGHSCGTHMAALLTTQSSRFFPADSSVPSSIRSCIGCEGMYDVSVWSEDFPDWLSALRRVFPDDWDDPTSAVSWSSSPLSVPPWLLLHSMDDQWVNRRQAELWSEFLHSHCSCCSSCVNDVPIAEIIDIHGGHFEVVESIGKESKDLVTRHITSFVQRTIRSSSNRQQQSPLNS